MTNYKLFVNNIHVQIHRNTFKAHAQSFSAFLGVNQQTKSETKEHLDLIKMMQKCAPKNNFFF